MSQWLLRIRTARRATAAVFTALVVAAVAAVWRGLVSGDTASVIVAAISLITGLFAWDTTGRAADIAEESHRTADTVAQIERDRWHADLTPQFNVSIRKVAPGSDLALLRIELVGPPALHRLDGVTIAVRNDAVDRTPRTPPPPTAEEVAAQIWGPFRFEPGVDLVMEPGRETPVFPLEIGYSRPFAMRMTRWPYWYEQAMWAAMYGAAPVRLWVVCELDGHRPWRIPFQVPVIDPAP